MDPNQNCLKRDSAGCLETLFSVAVRIPKAAIPSPAEPHLVGVLKGCTVSLKIARDTACFLSIEKIVAVL